MCTDASPLTPRQHTAITLLTAGHTISSIASILGVHRNTVHNWRNDPAFAAELTLRQTELAAASSVTRTPSASSPPSAPG